MEKQSLQVLLDDGLSIERIAKRFRKDPSTISYWMKKHRLDAPNRAERGEGKGTSDAYDALRASRLLRPAAPIAASAVARRQLHAAGAEANTA